MTDTPAPGVTPTAVMNDAPAVPANTWTLSDGTTVPLPPATPDQPAIGVLRQQAMGRIQELKGNEQFRALLLKGDAAALSEVSRLERIVNTPTGTFRAGEPSPAEIEQHQQAWNSFADLRLTYGEAVAEEQRLGGPLPEWEHRMAKTILEQLKRSETFKKALYSGDPDARAKWALVHRQISRPVALDPK